jgi:probable rRNA maturation factor
VIEVEIEDVAWTDALSDAVALVERASATALGQTGGDVVVLLTDDAAVQVLNARFRDKNQPTNVLSFPAADMTIPGQAPHLGDLVLAFGTCAAEAEAQGKSLADHLTT